MIRTVELDLYVQRHAPFPSTDPFTLNDDTTGMPVNITGATITMQVRDYEGAATARLDKTLTVTDGPRGQFGPPAISEADHEALIAAAAPDASQQSQLRLRYDIKIAGVSGFPSSFIAARGFYIVQTGVTL